MNDSNPSVLVKSTSGRALFLRLNRPERLNALDTQLHTELLAAVSEAAVDDSVGAVFISGTGKAFCSGGDLKQHKADDSVRETFEQHADRLRCHAQTTALLHSMPKPTVAVVNGAAVGAGMALALSCDFRIMSSTATMSASYVKMALSGDLGISYFLAHLAGLSTAKRLLFFGESINAQAAKDYGLTDWVVDHDGLEQKAMELAGQLSGAPPVAISYIKRNLLRATNGTLDEVINYEAIGMARCARTPDCKEAALAFREKRLPNFPGLRTRTDG